MFKTLWKKLQLVNVSIIKMVTISMFLLFITTGAVYFVVTSQFLSIHNDGIVHTIKNSIKDQNLLLHNFYHIENKIEVTHLDKHFILEDNKFVPTKHDLFETDAFNIMIDNNVTLYFPNFVEYNFGELIIRMSIEHENKTILLIFFIIFTIILTSTLVFHIVLQAKLKRLHDFKISAQEYALAERTTSYLVSIMHHKLNTPLKVLSTKSRVMAQAIFDSNIDSETRAKAEDDFVKITNALKTISEITAKLRAFKTASQTELNIYKIFGTAIETIEILRDDEVEIDVDRKTKLFNIDKEKLTPHEMIQVFINQIKFSLEEMSTEINIRVFHYDNERLKILFSDNGNIIDPKVVELIKNKKKLESLSPDDKDHYYSDLILNLNILEESGGSLKVISSNDNGTTYEIVIPTKKIILPNKKKWK